MDLTRKSSCVNARNIPPTAYQVLVMLLCLMGGGGIPHPVMMVGGTPSSHGGGGGTPSSHVGGGYPSPPTTIQVCPGGYPGYPPPSRPGTRYPPPQNVNRQTPVKTVPSLVLRTRAIISCGNKFPDLRCNVVFLQGVTGNVCGGFSDVPWTSKTPHVDDLSLQRSEYMRSVSPIGKFELDSGFLLLLEIREIRKNWKALFQSGNSAIF